MCGIVGVYHFDRETVPDEGTFLAQVDSLVHRGPDDGGALFGPGVALGHRRLSIIDLGGGRQPMVDAEERLTVVFNGEIYNYRELKKELEGLGYRFQSDSDTETILYAYREWGERCVDRFRGMFALAIHDRKTGDLFLARDRLGKKPLYVYRDHERLIFASELKAILADRRVPRVLEPEAVTDFFAYNYVPGPRTMLQHIEKLPAGHYLFRNGSREVLRSYWDVDFGAVDPGPSLAERAEELRAELDTAVALRLRSDVPLGAFLSGGIDSSLIVALMAGQLQSPVKTHTIGFSEQAYDERGYAKETALRFGTEHFERVVSADATDVVERLAWFYDEPFGDSSAVPTYYLSGATRERVTVALSGDGGDETFAGYRRYVFASIEDQVRRRLPGVLRHGLVGPLARAYPKADYLPQFLRAKATLTNLSVSHERAYFLSLTQKTYPRFLCADFRRGQRGYDPYVHFERHLARVGAWDALARLQYIDFKMYLADDILVKVDRASMAHALEVRVPILDHRVTELAARMPSNFKLDGRETKIVLKKVAAQLLPPSTFERKKMGFSIPLPSWFRSGLKPRAEELFFREAGGRSGVLDTAGLRRLWREHQSGLANHATSLWSILMFELWARQFLTRAPAVRLTSVGGVSVAPTRVERVRRAPRAV